MPKYGLISDSSTVRSVKMKVGNSGSIVAGDIVIEDADASFPYIEAADAGANVPIGVAMESSAAPTTDGDYEVLVCIDPQAIFQYPPDTGSATATLIGNTMDIGGSQSLNIDAGDDNKILIVDVDVENNLLKCMIDFTNAGFGSRGSVT